jgi:23S rRNA (cytidine2498-2'-O)-methyltransferase
MDAERYVASTTQTFDIILNDIRQEPRDSAALMERCAPLLKTGGSALVTIKLRHAKREQILAATLQRLSQSYAFCRARQLFHNRSEVTVVLREPVANGAP